MKIALAGVGLNILGSALLVAATGALALPLLITGRALQGFAAACIMPSTMALLKAYWDGPARQRAVSMWSIGSWGGSGLAAVFGGGVVASLGWRWIFVISIAVSVLAFFLIVGTPENKPAAGQGGAFDYLGLILFVAGTLSVMVILIFGQGLGWASPTVIALGALAIASFFFFIRWERQRTNPFIDLSLFRNTTFTGATISNFLLNCTIGILIVSQQLLQLAGQKADGSAFTAWDAGVLTIGYGVFIIGFIRVGEKLLQRFGPRKPMVWGSLIVIVSIGLLMQTELLVGHYVVLAVIAYCLFGLGLAFYATPSTDAALSNLPGDKAGSGSGIYKMASSLGSAMGAAVSLAVFTAMAGTPSRLIGDVIEFQGRTDNLALRQAAMVALGDQPDLRHPGDPVDRDDGAEGRGQPRPRRDGGVAGARATAPAGRGQGRDPAEAGGAAAVQARAHREATDTPGAGQAGHGRPGEAGREAPRVSGPTRLNLTTACADASH